ncbi:hypothetical protein CAL13_02200 [Bordetella genomosp. 9]|uniref:Uncharacterized protein n=1 Tax=Bordetella genomosp. 9 TaxID=1416803 RepID=A0A1W6YW78_9BORD|nr:hypothetical protein CAL13_02200 [Bordetella genomosp. 9]
MPTAADVAGAGVVGLICLTPAGVAGRKRRRALRVLSGTTATFYMLDVRARKAGPGRNHAAARRYLDMWTFYWTRGLPPARVFT